MVATADIDPAVLRRAGNRFAAHFDASAVVVEEIGQRLLGHLEPLSFDAGLMVDAGGGVGGFSAALAGRYAGAEVVAVNSARRRLAGLPPPARRWWPGSRRHTGPRGVCADPGALPFADGACAALISNLALAALGEPDAVLAAWGRALRPGAPCVFSTLGPDSFGELRAALAAAGQPDTVHPFYDMHDVGDAMIRAGFSSPVLDVERLTVSYGSVQTLINELRNLGGFSALRNRPRGLRTPAWLRDLAGHYAAICGGPGQFTVTLEVIYAHGWRRGAADRPQDGSTVSSFPIDQLRRRS